MILFQERFAPLVAAGTKRQTIRKTARCKVGDWVSLRRWSGKAYRSKQEVLRTDVCTAVVQVRIDRDSVYFDAAKYSERQRARSERHLDRIAVLDGFKDWAEMRDWFESVHGLPFSGWLIEWSGVDETKGVVA